jgi:hypothetical protein
MTRSRMPPRLEPLEARRLLSLATAVAENPIAGPASAAAGAPLAESSVAATAAPLDTVVFGNSASETAHGFSSVNSQVIAGNLSQPARQLLPYSTPTVNGGEVTFTVAVDPVQRNYFTLKLWGGDDTDQGKGRLYLYVPANGVNYQVGYRHEGDYAPLSVTASKPPLPGRFFYSTTLLPLAMTQGKTSITLKILSTGELYGLGSGGPPSGNYQMNMDTPGRGIYRAYTHTQPMLDVSGETQGSAPATTTRNTHTEAGVLGPTGTYTAGLNNWVTSLLNAAGNSFTTSETELLARSYSVSQLANAYQKSAVVNKVIAVLDGFAANYYASPFVSTSNPGNAVTGSNNYGGSGGNEAWGGRYGPLGWAIHLLSSVPSFQNALDTVADFGTGTTLTRRQAWGDMLLGSREYGRFTRDNRYLTNQGILSDINIYKANRGLLDLGNPSAFTETAAQRYLKESVGLLPWLGSDLPGGGSSLKFGSDYDQVTQKGLTREWGYAGGYSEMSVYAASFYQWTGNAAFKDQAVKMLKAIASMRRPAIDVSGASNYRSMEREGLLAWRGVREADGYFSNEIAYGNQGPWSSGMRVAGVTLDPTAVGYAKQMLADGQYFSQLVADSRYYSSLGFDALGAMEVYDDYNAVKAAADSGIRLPMTAGQPDFAWADEEAGLVAIKRGNDRLWVEPYWQAKDGTGVNGLARFHYSTATYDQYGVLETTPQFDSNGAYAVRTGNVDLPERTLYQPPDNPSQAYAGEKLLLGTPPADALAGEPYRGKVDFWGFRFGNYLFGVNASTDRSYELKTPSGFTSATDLVSSATKSGSVTVAPASTVVLYVAANADAAPVPAAPLWVNALGSPAQVKVEWSAASGASSYNVKRAASPAGPYTTIAANVTATSFIDTGVTRGTTYYYVVTASNDNGESYPSARVSASAGLPAPWANQDIGAQALPGSASRTSGVYTVRGSASSSNGGIGGTADNFHFAYLPVSGNVTIVTNVTSMLNTDGSDRAGVMIRESLGSDSRMAAILFEDSGNVRLHRRTTTGGSSATSGSISGTYAPGWMKLERVGNTFNAYLSADGMNWGSPFSSQSITMNSAVYVGLAVASNWAAETNVATFSNTSVVAAGNTAPTVATPAAATTDQATGTTAALSVLGADAGGEGNVIYTWSVTGTPPGSVAFSANGTNGAKSAVATFGRAGTYQLRVTVTDLGGAGLSATSDVAVSVAGGPTVYAGGAGDDAWLIRRSGANIDVWAGGGDGSGTPTYSVPFASAGSLRFDGNGGNDTLTIDNSGGEAAPAGGVTFNGGAGDDTLALIGGSSVAPVTFNDASGNQIVHVSGGTFAFASDIGATAENVTLEVVGSSAVTLGASQRLAGLAIGAGAVVTVGAAGNRVLDLAALDIATGGRLDLVDNRMIVRNTSPGGWSGAYTGLSGYVASGRAGGTWAGPGVGSSSTFGTSGAAAAIAIASAADAMHLAAGQTATWSGQTVSASDTLIRFTYAGDADLNGRLDGDDYFILDSHAAQSAGMLSSPPRGWWNGDFDYSGKIDGDDFFLLDSNIGRQGIA